MLIEMKKKNDLDECDCCGFYSSLDVVLTLKDQKGSTILTSEHYSDDHLSTNPLLPYESDIFLKLIVLMALNPTFKINQYYLDCFLAKIRKRHKSKKDDIFEEKLKQLLYKNKRSYLKENEFYFSYRDFILFIIENIQYDRFENFSDQNVGFIKYFEDNIFKNFNSSKSSKDYKQNDFDFNQFDRLGWVGDELKSLFYFLKELKQQLNSNDKIKHFQENEFFDFETPEFNILSLILSKDFYFNDFLVDLNSIILKQFYKDYFIETECEIDD